MAFLSYAHADDDEGEVTRFVDRLKREIRQQLGRSFEVFRDRDDIQWGENWRRRIDESLDSVTFLIAILSPSFFQSEECLRELERFRQRERELRRDDLILPVVWIEPDELTEEGHQHGSFLSQRQYTNWEDYRFHEPYPVEARQRIVTLARAVKASIRRAAPPERKPEPGAEARAQPATPPKAQPETPRSRPTKKPPRSASREGVGVIDGIPDILWRAVPGGEVEIDGHGRFPVEPFHMAAFPVTNAQFRAFLDADGGHSNDRWWQGLAADRDDRKPAKPTWSEPDHPRETLNWYEAVAFCRWLSEKLGYEVRLPDEHEWQWAAQSARDDFVYPWGLNWKDGVANTRESGAGRTTAVTAHPAGDSGQGVAGLTGNVWEWCRSEYEDPKRGRPDGRRPRVVRGVSWFNNLDGARADFRSFDRPNVRLNNLGFRVVCSSPIW